MRALLVAIERELATQHGVKWTVHAYDPDVGGLLCGRDHSSMKVLRLFWKQATILDKCDGCRVAARDRLTV